MTWTDIGIVLIPTIFYVIGYTHGYLRGKDAGIHQERLRKVNQ